jgi:protein TonB
MTEPHDQHDDTTDTDGQRRPYRPPVGMPLRRDVRWGAPFSFAVHVLLILLLITPLFARIVAPELFPGGGLGPAGGGGGGRGGFGGWRPAPITPEGLRYLRVAPEPPPSETAEPTSEVVPVPKEETPPPQPDPPAEQAAPEQSAPAAAPLPGTGGGTGNDGTSGTGPGTGGGVGSGAGTGTGSANGPGTGGGEGRDYLPTPDMLVLAPEPRPGRVRGKAVTITFSLNERGEILRIDFESTGDRGYDRRLRERMNEMRFRPAVGPDGRPIAATFPVTVRL